MNAESIGGSTTGENIYRFPASRDRKKLARNLVAGCMKVPGTGPTSSTPGPSTGRGNSPLRRKHPCHAELWRLTDRLPSRVRGRNSSPPWRMLLTGGGACAGAGCGGAVEQISRHARDQPAEVAGTGNRHAVEKKAPRPVENGSSTKPGCREVRPALPRQANRITESMVHTGASLRPHSPPVFLSFATKAALILHQHHDMAGHKPVSV